MEINSDYHTFRESLLAAARGPFFPDEEFQTIIGLVRKEVDRIANSFTPATPIVGDVELALNNAMNNLLGYPHGQDATWSHWLSITPAELRAVFLRWRASGNEF